MTPNEPNDVLSFIIYSNFGFFRKPDVSKSDGEENRLTYEFIPKPVLLGVLGSMGGLMGYHANERVPEFYEKLQGLEIGVQPLTLEEEANPPYNSTDFLPMKSIRLKKFVKYVNFHGYGSYYLGGTWIIKEQVLIKPAFRIFLRRGKCNVKEYENVKKRLETITPVYSPYMGKNEFPLSLIFEGSYEAKAIDRKSIQVDTIFFADIGEESKEVLPPGERRYYLTAHYPYKLNDSSQYITRKVIYTNREFNFQTFNKDFDLVEVNERNVFLF